MLYGYLKFTNEQHYRSLASQEGNVMKKFDPDTQVKLNKSN